MKIALLLLACCTYIFSGTPVIIHPIVDEYVHKYSTSDDVPHRSGLLKDEKKVLRKSSLKNDTIFTNERLSAHWKASTAYEYSISQSNTFDIKSLPSLTDVYYDSLYNTLTISSAANSFDSLYARIKANVKKADNEELIALAESFLKSNLQQYWNYLEYDRVDLTMKDNSEILSTDVCFRRIFRGGIVLDNVSYVKITINCASKVTCVTIRWPQFEKIDVDSSLSSLDDALTIAKGIYADTYFASNSSDTSELSSIEIVGTSRAWHKVVKDNKMILSPCYSFLSKGTLRDGQLVYDRVNVPMIKSYFLKR